MMTIRITTIHFSGVPNGAFISFCSVTFDAGFCVEDIKVLNKDEKLFLAMPARQDVHGEYHDVFHPVNSKFRRFLEREIFAAWKRHVIRGTQ